MRGRGDEGVLVCYIFTISKLAALVQPESLSAILHWTRSLKREQDGKTGTYSLLICE